MTDIAFAEAMMTVNAAAKGAFRIVEVHPAQILKANNTGKISERFLAFGRVRKSYPAAKAWQVSMQTPTRDLSSTPSIIAARCSNLNPKLLFLTGGVFNHRGDTEFYPAQC